MATVNTPLPGSILQVHLDAASGPVTAAGSTTRSAFHNACLLLVISLAAIAIDGYHPFSEDAGIYVASIKQLMHPAMYGSSAAFVTPYVRLSLFSHCNAWLLASLHLSIESVLFAMQVATTWLLVFACWQIARRCFRQPEAQWAATLLVAVCLAVPVAGSSLFLMDPYLTGRSFSIPLSLLAICACLDRKMLRAALLLALTVLFHPLMSIYALGFVLLLCAIQRRSWFGVTGLVLAAIGAGAIVQFSQRAVTESIPYRVAIDTRDYIFLSRWRWYELAGLAAPVTLLCLYVLWQVLGQRKTGRWNGVYLAQTAAVLGLTSVAISLLFVRPLSHSHLLATLQPMRAFVLIYFCMFLLLGGLLGEYLLQRVAWRWLVLFSTVGAVFFAAQRLTYPSSAHLELPLLASNNGWVKAFLWTRHSVPSGAVVALDADYMNAPGEDSQGFRAIAEHNSLADRAKDGGGAAIFPQLAERWMREQTATTGLNSIDDAERRRRLLPFRVTWIILDRSSPTNLDCPFQNERAKVCQLK